MTEKTLVTVQNNLSRQSCTTVYVKQLFQQIALELYLCSVQPENYKIPDANSLITRKQLVIESKFIFLKMKK